MIDTKQYQDLENAVWDASCASEDNEGLFSAIDTLVESTTLSGIRDFQKLYRQHSHRENLSVEVSYDRAVETITEKMLDGQEGPEGFHTAFRYVCAMIAYREDPEYVTDQSVVGHLIDRECPNGRRYEYRMTRMPGMSR